CRPHAGADLAHHCSPAPHGARRGPGGGGPRGPDRGDGRPRGAPRAHRRDLSPSRLAPAPRPGRRLSRFFLSARGDSCRPRARILIPAMDSGTEDTRGTQRMTLRLALRAAVVLLAVLSLASPAYAYLHPATRRMLVP